MSLLFQGFLTAKNYTYAIVGTDDIDKANALLYDTYHPDEPLNKVINHYLNNMFLLIINWLIILKHLGLTAGGRRIKDCDAMVEQIVPRHLCLFAIHPSGKPIGVAINNDCQKSELEVPTEQVRHSEIVF